MEEEKKELDRNNTNEMDSSDEELNLERDELYDSDADDKDEKYLLERMKKKNKNDSSDATLACPLCFENICYDCQRHVKFTSQYRSMLAENVELNLGVKLSYKDSKESINSWEETEFDCSNLNVLDPAELLDENTYFPVHCMRCKCKVGIYDYTEMFLFWNVIALPPN